VCSNTTTTGTPKQLTDEIMSRKLFNEDVTLTEEDIQQFLERLCYDGTVQRIFRKRKRGSTDSTVYIAVPSRKRSKRIQHFTSTPCGVCKLIDQCTPTGVISPATCPYLNDWLDVF